MSTSKPDLFPLHLRSILLLSDGCRQEKLFEREQVFGRDASSVFPTEGQRAAAEAAEALKSKLGANRFISESEVLLTCCMLFVTHLEQAPRRSSAGLFTGIDCIHCHRHLSGKLGRGNLLLQIQELQKEYGGSTEGSEPIKPLAHILLEAKQAKEEAFQNQWKQMKQGAAPQLNTCSMHFLSATLVTGFTAL